MKYACTILVAAMLTGCTTSAPTSYWSHLTSGNANQRLEALRQMDRRIRKGMTEAEVRAVFPPDSLVTFAPASDAWVLTLSEELYALVLKPHSEGAIFGIEFNEKDRVSRHWLALRPEL